jgi:hypothetical protein
MTTKKRTNAVTGPFRTWELAENSTVRLSRGRSATVVRVARGTVLVTQRGDLEDHVLEPGDEVVLDGSGLAVAWAFTAAAISLREVANGSNPRRSAQPENERSSPPTPQHSSATEGVIPVCADRTQE